MAFYYINFPIIYIKVPEYIANYNESKSDGYKMNYKYHTKEIKGVF